MAKNLENKQRKSMVARRVKEIREHKGLTQHDLAKLMGCSQGLVSQYEASLTTLSLDGLIVLCDALGCSVDYLLGRDVDYTPTTPRGRLLKAFGPLSTEVQDVIIAMIEGI